MAVDVYVEDAFTTLLTVNTVLAVDRLREKFPSVQVPFTAVVQVNVPLWLVNVPLTEAPATGFPDESMTSAVTFGCHLVAETAVVALSRSPM